MEVEFDEAKDALNMKQHGLSLARAADLDFQSIELDDRFKNERRYKAYGILDELPHFLAFVVLGRNLRAISLRRAHSKEYRRYVK